MLKEKYELLDAIENAFNAFSSRDFGFACSAECPVCCTRDVTATTLEALRMLDALKAAGRTELIDKLSEVDQNGLFRPKLTTNTLAMACLTQQEPPMEEPGTDQGACIFLENNLCVVYEARPFSCRGMFSKLRCQPGMEAEAPDILVIMVSICWQIIEHLDVNGLYGNLIDLMVYLNEEKHAASYKDGGKVMMRGVPPTKPVPGLLVPPDHQDEVQAFLDGLYATDCGGRTFRDRMREMRQSPF